MVKRRFRLILLVWLLGLVACSTGPDVVEQPSLTLSSCRLDQGVEAQCGTLPVFEDRAAASGRTIDLHVAVVPATGGRPDPDPLFLLAGGPGQAATEAFPPLLPFLEDINEDRDIVLVDQRGTGRSNPLQCPNFVEVDFGRELSDEEVQELVQECLNDLRAELTLYTTDVAMADLDEVRMALGYEQINLYGASYGTRAALTYLRHYPERVRTVTLDAVVGPELVLYQQMPRDGQEALQSLFSRCAQDPACQQQFPDLQTEFEALLDRLETPMTISVVHPLNGELVEVTLTRDLFMQFIFNLLYSTDFVSILPLLIHNAYEHGEFTPLVAQTLAFREDVALYYGLLYSVTCSEDAPFISLPEARELRQDTYFPLVAEPFLQVCDQWPQREVPAGLRQPVVSEVPVLLLSGGADPVTPPRYARQVAQTLPNSRHLVAPGYGHGILIVGCVPDIVTDFITAGSIEVVETGCLEALQPPPFFVDFAGPRP